MKIKLVLLILLLSSCATKGTKDHSLPYGKASYNLTDMSGTFVYEAHRGSSKNDKDLILKTKIYTAGDSEKVLEKRIVISTPGILGKKVRVLRPKISQVTVWLEGKKYFVETKINTKTKRLDVLLRSPESQWNGTKSYKFPNGTGVYCYFSQLVDCIAFTGFFQKAEKNKAGEVAFHVLWEGYPYFNEQYPSLPSTVFSRAKMSYEGEDEKGDVKYTLDVEGQAIFYLLKKKTSELEKMYWVTQGFSLIRK